MRYFDDLTDRLDFGDTLYAALNFKPQFLQYMKGFKLVLCNRRRGATRFYFEEGHHWSCVIPSFLILY